MVLRPRIIPHRCSRLPHQGHRRLDIDHNLPRVGVHHKAAHQWTEASLVEAPQGPGPQLSRIDQTPTRLFPRPLTPLTVAAVPPISRVAWDHRVAVIAAEETSINDKRAQSVCKTSCSHSITQRGVRVSDEASRRADQGLVDKFAPSLYLFLFLFSEYFYFIEPIRHNVTTTTQLPYDMIMTKTSKGKGGKDTRTKRRGLVVYFF